MPLEFQSLSHGRIPIGFFNIDTDMILIKNYFIFANDFCGHITRWAKIQTDEVKDTVEIYVIQNEEDIGNLMGAIYGITFTGFIGEVYKRFPFPEKKVDFKQKPNGIKNRKIIEEIVKKYGEQQNIQIKIDKKSNTIEIGEFKFSKDQFHEVIGYIWRGGMPEWRDDIRPEYVNEMMKTIITSTHWFFKAETKQA